jgi:hypothetical protein
MNLPLLPIKIIVLLLTSCLLLVSCSSGGGGRPKKVVLQGQSSAAVDFSGSWEMDYAQSDNIQTKLDTMVRELQRQAERRSQGGNQGAIMVGGSSGPNSAPSIIGLARMSDLITRSPLLKIKQSEHEIKVKREENFALTCEFYAGQFQSVETPLGTEICGWNGHQFVFKILLPDGLSIQHVMTMASSGGKLNIATTVVSDQVSYPFTLNRVYNHFVPGRSGFSCKMTLTKGRVCSTQSAPTSEAEPQ